MHDKNAGATTSVHLVKSNPADPRELKAVCCQALLGPNVRRSFVGTDSQNALQGGLNIAVMQRCNVCSDAGRQRSKEVTPNCGGFGQQLP